MRAVRRAMMAPLAALLGGVFSGAVAAQSADEMNRPSTGARSRGRAFIRPAR